MTAVLPGWKTPLEEMAGHDRLASQLVQHAEACLRIDYRSKVERVGQVGVLMADRQPNPDVAEALFQGLIDAIYEWHEWDLALDAGMTPSTTREQADYGVLWALAACTLGTEPCQACVHDRPTVHGIKPAELPSSLDCDEHRQTATADRRRFSVRGLLGMTS